MKTRDDLVRQWIAKANKDLLAANQLITFEDAVFETICFSCQQAIEKFLKAYLIFFNAALIKTHDIGELIKKCSENDREILTFFDEADTLTLYAVEVRYPDSFFEVKRREAIQAIEITIKLKTYILSKIDKQDTLF